METQHLPMETPRLSPDSKTDEPAVLKIRKVHNPNSVLTVGAFKHRTLGSSSTAQAMFVPAGYEVEPTKLLEIVAKRWQLEVPNILVQFDAGSAHPLNLATHGLANLEQFTDWKADANLKTGRPVKKDVSAPETKYECACSML